MDYNEKCFALIGDTKPLMYEIKKLGGKPNYLKDNNGDKFFGWISHQEKANHSRNVIYKRKRAVALFFFANNTNKLHTHETSHEKENIVALKTGSELMVITNIFIKQELSEPLINCKWYDRASKSTHTKLFLESQLQIFDWYRAVKMKS